MCFMVRLKSAIKKLWAKAKVKIIAYIDYEQVLTECTAECKTKEEM